MMAAFINVKHSILMDHYTHTHTRAHTHTYTYILRIDRQIGRSIYTYIYT